MIETLAAALLRLKRSLGKLVGPNRAQVSVLRLSGISRGTFPGSLLPPHTDHLLGLSSNRQT